MPKTKVGMTVKELRKKLADFDDDLPVHIGYNYGDYWRTIVCPGVKAIGEFDVEHSEYHRMPMLPTEEYEDDEDRKERGMVSVVVLSAEEMTQ